MAKSLDQNNAVAAAEPVVAPLYLLRLGFNAPIFTSSRETVAWDGQTWLQAPVQVFGIEGGEPTLSAINSGTLIGQLALTEKAAGRSVKVWRALQYVQRNLVKYSDDLNTWSLESGATRSDGVDDPWGGTLATYLENTSGGGNHVGMTNNLDNYSQGGIAADTVYTLSGHFREASSGRVFFGLRTSVSEVWHGGVYFDWVSGEPSLGAYSGPVSSHTFQKAGNGYWRVAITFTSTSDTTSPTIHIDPDRDFENEGVDVCGFQLEAGQLSAYQSVPGAVYSPGDAPAGYTEPQLVFSGQMGAMKIDRDRVTIQCRRLQPLRTPRLYAHPPVFNHLPRAGTRFETPTQIITLE